MMDATKPSVMINWWTGLKKNGANIVLLKQLTQFIVQFHHDKTHIRSRTARHRVAAIGAQIGSILFSI